MILQSSDAARITKLDIDIVHHEPWKPIYFEVEKVNVTRHKKHIGVGLQEEHNIDVCCWVFSASRLRS